MQVIIEIGHGFPVLDVTTFFQVVIAFLLGVSVGSLPLIVRTLLWVMPRR